MLSSEACEGNMVHPREVDASSDGSKFPTPSPPTPQFNTPSIALRRFVRSFDELVDYTNTRLQSINRDRLKVLYDESHGHPTATRQSLSVASGELSGAYQKDIDAPMKFTRNGGNGNRGDYSIGSEGPDLLAGTVKPRGSVMDPQHGSAQSDALSIGFPVLSVSSSLPSTSLRPRSTNVEVRDEDAPKAALPSATKVSPRPPPVKTAAEELTSLPRTQSDCTPLLPGSFKDSGSYLSNPSHVGAPDRDRDGYRRYLQYAQRVMRDPTIDVDTRNKLVDEVVTSSLALYNMSEKLYTVIASLSALSPEEVLLDSENNMVPVLQVPDSPTFDERGGTVAIAQRNKAVGSTKRTLAGDVHSPISVPAALLSVPDSLMGTSDMVSAGQSISFVRTRRESCPSSGSGDCTYNGSMTSCSTSLEVLNHFYIVRRLGVGTTGTVSLCVDQKTRKPYAVKSMMLPRKSNLHNRLRNFSQTSDDAALMSISDAPPRSTPTPAPPEVSRQEREIRLMRRLHRCPHVVRLHEVIDDEDENMVHLIMTLAEGGAISDVKPYDLVRKCAPCTVVRPLSRLAEYGRQLLSALAGLQQQRIIHNDIKPDNILLKTANEIILGDFGESVLMPPTLAMNPNASVSAFFPAASTSLALFSRRSTSAVDASPFGGLTNIAGFDPGFMPDSSMFLPPSVGKDGKLKGTTAAGTPAFSAPELIEHNMCSYASDVWSFGVVMYSLVFGRLPFAGQSVVETYRCILTDPLTFPAREELPDGAALTQAEYDTWVGLCRSILVRDPLQRPTVRALASLPLFANAAPIPAQSRPNSHTSASVASQKLLNAVLNSKEHVMAPLALNPVPGYPSPLQSTGSAAFLAEVGGYQSLSSRNQIPYVRMTSPPRAIGVPTNGILTRPTGGISSGSSQQSSGSASHNSAAAPPRADDVLPSTLSSVPAPPARHGASTTAVTAAMPDRAEHSTHSQEFAGSIPSTLLDYAKIEDAADSPGAAAAVADAAVSASSQSAATVHSPPFLPATRTGRQRDHADTDEKAASQQPLDHGPIVSFLADSHSLDAFPSTTGRRLLRSTATTAAYHDEDPFGSHFSSRAGGRSTLGSRTVTTVPSSLRETDAIDEDAPTTVTEAARSAASSINSHSTTSVTYSSHNEDTIRSNTAAAHRIDETRSLPAVYSPHIDSATTPTSTTVDNSSITSFRDPHSGSSLAASSAAESARADLLEGIPSRRGTHLSHRALESRKANFGDSRKGPRALLTEMNSMHNASFHSVPLSSDADVLSNKSQPINQRLRGRRRINTRGRRGSTSDDELIDFPREEEDGLHVNRKVDTAPIRVRDNTRFVQVTEKEVSTIQHIAEQLFPYHSERFEDAGAAVPEARNEGSDTLPPPPNTP